MTKEEELFDDVTLQTPQDVDTRTVDVVTEDKPSRTSLEWNDYVLSLFDESEMFDGRPTCQGLRRIAELELGEIVSSRPTQVTPSTVTDNTGRVTVVWEVIFASGKLFSDLADSWDGNTDEAFCPFATCLAGTRAEGRALRKALGVKVATVEEMTKKDTAAVTRDLNSRKESTDGGYDEGDRMTDPQANFIDVKCGKKKGGLNTDVTDFFKKILNINVKQKITKAQASDAIEKLNEYQAAGLPSELTLPYSSDWRN